MGKFIPGHAWDVMGTRDYARNTTPLIQIQTGITAPFGEGVKNEERGEIIEDTEFKPAMMKNIQNAQYS